MIESGLFNLWDQIFLTKTFRGTHFEYNNKEHLDFNLEDILSIFYILSFFLSISTAVLFIEIVYMLINRALNLQF